MQRSAKWMIGAAGAAMVLGASVTAEAGGTPGYAKGREPVYRCDTAGFIEYPGSDTCFKIGGRVVAWLGGQESNVNSAEEYDVFDIVVNPTNNDRFWMRSLGRFNLDIRTASEYGIVRAFMEVEAKDNNTNSGGAANLRHAFIQIGNFLIGKTDSSFLFSMTPERFAEAFQKAPGHHDQRIVQVRYTVTLGNGVSITLAAEDPARLDGAYGAGLAAGANHAPDFVATLRVKQSWGALQAGITTHKHSYIFATSQQPWGWAVHGGAALYLKNIGTGKDAIYIQGNYSDGFSRALRVGTTLSIGATGVGVATDMVTAMSVLAGYRHFWNGRLRSTIGVGHSDIDYNNVVVAGTVYDNATTVWGNLIWSPVKGLDVGVEVMWSEVEFVNGVNADAMAAVLQVLRKF